MTSQVMPALVAAVMAERLHRDAAADPSAGGPRALRDAVLAYPGVPAALRVPGLERAPPVTVAMHCGRVELTRGATSRRRRVGEPCPDLRDLGGEAGPGRLVVGDRLLGDGDGAGLVVARPQRPGLDEVELTPGPRRRQGR